MPNEHTFPENHPISQAGKIVLSRTEAYEMLCEADHAWIDPDYGIAIAKAFDVIVKPERSRVSRNHPKGLDVPGKKNGEVVEGFDARSLADTIAYALKTSKGAKYDNPMMGRGSGLRFALATIKEFVS